MTTQSDNSDKAFTTLDAKCLKLEFQRDVKYYRRNIDCIWTEIEKAPEILVGLRKEIARLKKEVKELKKEVGDLKGWVDEGVDASVEQES